MTYQTAVDILPVLIPSSFIPLPPPPPPTCITLGRLTGLARGGLQDDDIISEQRGDLERLSRVPGSESANNILQEAIPGDDIRERTENIMEPGEGIDTKLAVGIVDSAGPEATRELGAAAAGQGPSSDGQVRDPGVGEEEGVSSSLGDAEAVEGAPAAGECAGLRAGNGAHHHEYHQEGGSVRARLLRERRVQQEERRLPRSISASSLKEKLGKLAEAPSAIVANRVARLQANVDFAPAQIPWKRRMQTIAVATWSCMIVITVCLWFYLWSFPPLWPFLAAYFVWAMWIDDAPEQGGRRRHWVQNLGFWKGFAGYYPCQLLKEADLPPDRPYVFGYHPHGIIGMGAVATFATQATGFAKAYPGIHPRLLTLTSNFQIPLYRDILLALGICSVSSRSCSNVLKQGAGAAITIVVGGAAESLSAHPGTADLTLRKRLGFIKVAIRHGADLVPVFSFGENDIYNQMPNEKGTTTYALQRKFQSIFGFTLPLFHGRGLLNYNVGLMPYRRRIVVVIGRPISVTKMDKPSLEEVYRIQQQYIEELTRIWDTYKDEFAKSRVRELNIIE